MRQPFRFTFLFLCCLFATYLEAQDNLVISEILADNQNSLFDEDGDASDWIELYNATDAQMNLEGLVISDDNSSWTFPSVWISAKSYLVVFASDKDRSSGQELHANFKLSKNGEEVQIHDANNILVDSISYPALQKDESYGLVNGGLNNYLKFSQPSPGEENVESNIATELYSLISSHKSGFYPEGLSAFLSGNLDGHLIYYTLDGSLPNKNSSLYNPANALVLEEWKDLPDFAFTPTSYVWEAPKSNIPRATVLRAVSYDGDTRVSEVLNQSFWISQNPHTLPIVSLIGEEADFFDSEKGIYVEGEDGEGEKRKEGLENFFMRGREWERPVHVSFFDDKGDIFLQQQAGVRVSGANTRLQPQKSIRLYARSDYGKKTFDHPFWGQDYGGQFKRITFRTMNVGSWSAAGFQDDIIHDIIDGELDVDYVRRKFSVVYLNGVYWGLHSMREHNNQHYVERVYGVPEDEVVVAKAEIIESPTFNNFDDLVNDIFNLDLTDTEDFEEVASRLDIVGYADYVITNLAFANQDWPHNNVEFWYSDEYDGKVRYIINDLDATMGVHNDESLDFFIADQADRLKRNDLVRVLIFLQKLLEAPEYRKYFNNRMNQLMHSTFAPTNTIGVLERMVEEISPEMELHIDRWHYPKSVDKWEAAVDRLREFLLRRPLYLIERSNELFGFPIDVYPNPVKNQMFLELEAWSEGELRVEITDMTGRTVLQRSFDVYEGLQKVDLNMRGLPAGVFLLTAQYQGLQINQQVIKVVE